MTHTTTSGGWWRRAAIALGLVHSEQGRPLTGDPKRLSRYGGGMTAPSPRLDEDIDDLRSRVAALEERLRE